MKFYQYGRSMVEMLGVLAIIGVLSVGAIAGYSKAMMKYKLNKYSESMTLLLANAIQLSKQIPTEQATIKQYRTELLHKLNLLPDGFKLDENDNSFLIDVFGNNTHFAGRSGFGYNWVLHTSLANSSSSFEQCQVLYRIGKEFSSELIKIYREEDSAEDGYAYQSIWGDNDCALGKTPCLKDLTLNDIYNRCTNSQRANTTFSASFWWW